MNSINLNKLLQQDHWNEVLVLYSGLIDLGHKENLIENLETSNPLLAAQCINSNWASEIRAELSLVDKAKSDLILLNTNKSEIAVKSVYTLLELGQIEPIIPLIKNCFPGQIQIFKPLIPRIISTSGDKLEFVVFEILEIQPHIFLNQIFQILIQNPKNKSLLKKIYESIHNRVDIKKKHLFQFLKYFGINEKIYLSYEMQVQFVRIAKNYNDLKFIQLSKSFEINLKEIIRILFSQPLNSHVALMIIDVFANNSSLRSTFLDKYIKKIEQSENFQDQALYILLCSYFHRKSILSASRIGKQILGRMRIKNIINNEFLFNIVFTKLTDEIKKINSEKNALYLVGKVESVIVISEYRYHYLTYSKIHKFPILIPKSEADGQLFIGASYNVRLIFFYEESKTMFASIKQFNSKKREFKFDLEYLGIAKVGDEFKAKIVKISGRLNVKIYEIGKKTQVKILNPNFAYQEYVNLYNVRVEKVVDFHILHVLVLQPICQ